MTRIANREARTYVRNREVFKNNGGTLWGEWYEQGIEETGDIVRRYCVYSYRYSWPLFVAEESEDGTVHWYENIDRYSVTTSKHKGQAHPYFPTVPMTVNAMKRIVREGIAGLAAKGELQ
jgi:hypothetical protein